jgi:hypothetical protein
VKAWIIDAAAQWMVCILVVVALILIAVGR